jgi:hypothetical protein
MLVQQFGQHVHPVHQDRAFPGQVVQADVPQGHPRRRDAEPGGEIALEPDRHVAQADGAVTGGKQRPRDDPHRIGEIDDEG